MEKTAQKGIKILKRADVKPVQSTSGKVVEEGKNSYIAKKNPQTFSDLNCKLPQSSVTQNFQVSVMFSSSTSWELCTQCQYAEVCSALIPGCHKQGKQARIEEKVSENFYWNVMLLIASDG